jgi:hypothetical protein
LFSTLARARRAIGALVLVCLAMMTAAPVAAITLGDECEKQCCLRKAPGHACCKRTKAGTSLGMAAAQARCCPGMASVGLARLDGGTVAPMAVDVALAESGAAVVASPERQDALHFEFALFQRPPPVL